jgi:uncharacterized MnhB-related membrane protein
MPALRVFILLLVAIAGGAVALTRNPLHQVLGFSFYGLLLALMFFLFAAPDVALSQFVIGAMIVPMLVLLALSKLAARARRREGKEQSGEET